MYDTEQEQIEAIKKWWGDYGNAIIGAVIVALVAYFGWTFYQNSVQSSREEASALYDELLVLADSDNPDAETRAELIATLKQDYDGTVYAVYAALQGARAAVESDDLDAALTELDWALDNAEASLVPVIRLRKARVQYADGQLDAALATLDAIDQEGFEVASGELRGDILATRGDTDAARSAYQAALEASQQQGIESPYLQMKLNDLAPASDEA